MAATDLHLADDLRPLVAALAAFFRGRSVEAYAVGGFLRDALLARGVRDVDVAVAGDPGLLAPQLADELGGHQFALDEERGLVRITFSDRRLHVDLLPLRGSIEDDLRRRDFTIDAMAARLEGVAAGGGEIIDPTGGHADLSRRRLRVTGEEAFREDPLRPLRGARLATELEFAVEGSTAELIRRYAPFVARAARERQRDELVRVLATPRAGAGLRLLDELGLLEQLMPQVTACRGVEQPREHHWDVFGHSLAVVGNLDVLLAEEKPRDDFWPPIWRELWGQLAWWHDSGRHFGEEIVPGTPRTAVLKLAGLLHDVAKPETKSFEKDGRMRFFGHADVGAQKAGRALRRLRFSSREVALVQTMVKAHLRPVQMGQSAEGEPSRRALYRYFRDCGDAAIDTLFLSLADHLGTVGPNVSRVGWRQHVSLVNYILTKRFQEEAVIAPPKLLRGDELMAELGLSPGPKVGRLLELIREAQAAGEVSTREEALALARAATDQGRTEASGRQETMGR